jgi:hypothetical protein
MLLLADLDQQPPADIIDPPERLGPVGSIIDPSYTLNEAVINRLEANVPFAPTKDLQKLLTICNMQQEQRKDKILAPILCAGSNDGGLRDYIWYRTLLFNLSICTTSWQVFRASADIRYFPNMS